MSQSAVVPKQMCIQQPFELSKTVTEGNEFHSHGPAVAKHWQLKLLCECRTTHIAVSVERSWHMLTSEISWQLLATYIGALLTRHWKTRTAILNWTRCHTRIHCSCHRIGVMWSWCHAPVTCCVAASVPIACNASALQDTPCSCVWQ